MDVWIKSLVDVLIAYEVSHAGACKLCPLMVRGMMQLCLGGVVK